MAIKVLALASGVTSLGDHRILNGAMMTSEGTLAVRGGALPGSGGLNLSTVSAMVARVAPGKVLIPNGVSAALGPYLLVSDANVDITFAAGEASVPRVDRIIARAYDNANDGSGSTMGDIYYLKGQASGAATALPTNSILLYEMSIPAGASAGGGGVNFANAVDQRVYTVAQGGIIPIPSNTAMGAITSPYEGMTIYRTDLDVLYVYDGTTWRARGVANVASSANLSSINNPYDGQLAATRDTDAVYLYNGTSWVQPKNFFNPVVQLVQQAAQSFNSNATAALTFGASSEIIDTHNFHDTVTNNTRITPSIAGYYRFTGGVTFSGATTTQSVHAIIGKNGSGQQSVRVKHGNFNNTSSSFVSCILQMNGTTDYAELLGVQVDSGAAARNSSVIAGQSSYFECEYIGPTSY